MKANLLIACNCILGEGPVWDERRGMLWWTDIDGKRIHRYDRETGRHERIEVPEKVGAFALREKGGIIVAAANGWALCNEDGSDWRHIADPEPEHANHRFNDGKCDASGRFYAGTYALDNQPRASLYVIQPDLSWERLADGVICSNGLAWSPDDRTFYYIDSLKKGVDRFQVDPATGRLSDRRTVITLEEPGVVPDGMTADEEGMLWVAEWGGWKVSRWNPRTGQRLMTVEVPAKYVTSCAFGGEGMDELFITTASVGLTEEERRQQPLAGSVFHIKVGVRGRPTYRFAG